MSNELCKPDNYGKCCRSGCDRTVTLVLGGAGKRMRQDIIDDANRQWVCEKCVESDYSRLRHVEWEPDELTKVVLAGADPLLANTFAEIQSFISDIFRTSKCEA